MADNKILITGATGTVGAEVVRQLASTGADVRALTRTPEKARLPADVEVVAGDLRDPASLDKPLADVDTVFLVWPMITSVGIAEVVEAVGRHAGRLVYLSANGVDLDEADVSNPILRFHTEIERAVRGSGLDWVNLRPASFAANTLGWVEQLRAGLVRAPFGSRRQALIHEADIAAVAALALTDDDLLGTSPEITGPESLVPAEQVAVLGEALGMPARFEEVPATVARDDAVDAGWPEGLANALFEADEPASQDTTTTFARITGQRARSLRQWAIDHAGAFP